MLTSLYDSSSFEGMLQPGCVAEIHCALSILWHVTIVRLKVVLEADVSVPQYALGHRP